MRSVGRLAALVLLDVRHGLKLSKKMHTSCQPANGFFRHDATAGALAGAALCR